MYLVFVEMNIMFIDLICYAHLIFFTNLSSTNIKLLNRLLPYRLNLIIGVQWPLAKMSDMK